MVKGYRYYLKSNSIADTAHFLRCSYSNVRTFITEIQRVLAGGEPKRLHGRQNILDAVYTLQRFPSEERVESVGNVGDPSPEPTPSVTTTQGLRQIDNMGNLIDETSEQEMNRLFEEFKTAVSDWTYELVEEKNRAILDAAKRSNIVDFLKQGLKR